MATDGKFSLQELMAVCAAREIRNDDVVFVGTGLPMLGSMLAKRTHAPDAVLVYESGVVDARPKRTPWSIGDGCLVPDSAMVAGLLEVFGLLLQRGRVSVGFLGAAQIDPYGNLNSSVIGEYYAAKVRLPGSGGGNDIGSLAHRTVIMMGQDKRKFVEKVDYITTPGFLAGPGAREAAGLPRGGPDAVISNLGVYRFDAQSKRIFLETYHPGVTLDQVKENVQWALAVAPYAAETKPPHADELRLLRDELDPDGIFLGGG